MAIINRLARLFKADFHAVLDHIEDPELQLKQAVREMEEQLATVAAQIQQHTRELNNLAERKNSADQLLVKTNDEIEVCIDNSNDDLARGLVRRKLETIKALTTLSAAHERLTKTRQSLETRHKEYLVAIEGMRQKADLYDSTSTDQSSHSTIVTDVFTVSDEDVEVALLKERQRFGSTAKAS